MISSKQTAVRDEVGCDRWLKVNSHSTVRAVGVLALLTIAALPLARAQAMLGAPILDNERVKVWDVTLTPGQPMAITNGANDFIALVMAGGEIKTTYTSGKTSTATQKFGDAVYSPKGTLAMEEVVSPAPARMFVVELKEHALSPVVNKSGYALSFPRPGSTKVFENSRVIIWDYVYKDGVPTPMHYHDKDALVAYRYDAQVSSTTPDGKVVVNDDVASSVRFNKGDRSHIEALVKGQESVIVIEFK